MCTALTLENKKQQWVFGRNMDFTILLDPSLYVVPRNYHWKSRCESRKFESAYAFIGAGQEIDGQIIVADGVNEKGLAGGMLYFPGYASYEDCPSADEGIVNLAAIEFLNYCLGSCADTQAVRDLIFQVCLVGISDSVTGIAAPLHWIFADASGKSIVVEKTADVFTVYDNPIGVLANSPEFPWHMTHLRLFLANDSYQKMESEWGSVTLQPFGQGAGSYGIPGDYTAPSRFVKTAFQKTYLTAPENISEAIVAGFHILSGVAVPKGVVLNENGKPDYTQYTSFMDLQESTYYYSTYENRTVRYAQLQEVDMVAAEPVALCKMLEPTAFYPISR